MPSSGGCYGSHDKGIVTLIVGPTRSTNDNDNVSSGDSIDELVNRQDMGPRFVSMRRVARPGTSCSTSTSLIRHRRFTANPTTAHGRSVRPQLPFLSTPTRPHQFRYLTTERKAWIRHEVRVGIQYTLYIWMGFAAIIAIDFALNEERLERDTPTPHEWSMRTRYFLRWAHEVRDSIDGPTDWVKVARLLKRVIKRLEQDDVDGKGLQDASSSVVPGAKDISHMAEPWRRGYYETLMAYAKAAEHVNGWVRDRTRGLVFPPDMMVGPSNPYPEPIPFGAPSAPKEEDCEVVFPPPEEIYMRIIHTQGLSNRQRLDVHLAYGNWLEFKGLDSDASRIYDEAVHMATSETTVAYLDARTGILDDKAGLPSANLLRALTARATFQARRDPSSALPVLISLLRARRSLPKASTPVQLPATEGRESSSGSIAHVVALVRNFLAEPPYPPPPPDGREPPVRDAKELCEEAALQLYIGEILCAADIGKDGEPDQGLAWMREAVDVAETQLRRLVSYGGRAATLHAATSTCRQCLSASLQSWHDTTAFLALREREAKEAKAHEATHAEEATVLSSAWKALWGSSGGGASDGAHDQALSRWVAESKVVGDRMRRSRPLLEDLQPPRAGLMSLFRA